MSSRKAVRAIAANAGYGSPKRARSSSDLTDRQSQRFARAYRETGADSVEGPRKVLLGLLDPAERVVVDKRVRGGGR